MHKISVANIQRLCVNDGPGVRTVVFLRGCTLQCPWCCNPETIYVTKDIVFDKGVCTYPDSKFYCKDCELFKGTLPKIDCPIHAFETVSRDYDASDLCELLCKDQYIFHDGGVTFSGGEPLLQIDELVPVLQQLKNQGVNIAMETALYVPLEKVKKALPYVDYWMVDVKFQFGYMPNTEFDIENESVFLNIQLLQQNIEQKNITYRMVLMHEAIGNVEKIVSNLKENSIYRIELLEYHAIAENKYQQIGKKFIKYHPANETDMIIIQERFAGSAIAFTYSKL